ncbi:hypothetical protein E4U54_007329 [Claviceps lovelessii]|nr:hypothetical protein E4U54_007329 [Claviceps lovelessii]
MTQRRSICRDDSLFENHLVSPLGPVQYDLNRNTKFSFKPACRRAGVPKAARPAPSGPALSPPRRRTANSTAPLKLEICLPPGTPLEAVTHFITSSILKPHMTLASS